MNLILEAKDLTKHFNDLPVLEGLSFQVNRGEFVSIIGPSGCGKTTLLRTIGGLIEPTKGEVRVSGGPVKSALKQRQFGFVFQNPVLLPWKNVIKNIELPLEVLNQKNFKQSSRDLLKLVGLEDFGAYYPHQLSGGMQQRVAIARALIFEPSIMLMDEPFGSLDEITRNHMNLELMRIWQAETTKTSTVIFITHSIPEAVFLSDRIIVLSKRPSRIEKIINVDLPRPRKADMRTSQKYINLIQCLRETIKED